MFIITSMPVGGAETLLVNLVRRMDRERFAPEICCLKELGPLGEELAEEMPVHHSILRGKYDFGVCNRLAKLMTDRGIDAIVTVGAGDKMFWGRLAARRANLPVVCSAIHSTGWPDGIGRMNRMLTPITDAFIGVAAEHGRHLVEMEGFPESKVKVIPNGVDVARFSARPEERANLRSELGIPADAPLVGIVAALRPEKNHLLFLRAASLVQHECPEAHFVIVGDGPEMEKLTTAVAGLPVESHCHWLGSRSDVPELLAALDLFALTSHNEANPVSILEAMATELPVVATDVGSISESVGEDVTGHLTEVGNADEIAARWLSLLTDRDRANQFGAAGREKVVANWSLERMVEGYEKLIESIYIEKSGEGVLEKESCPEAVTVG